MNRFVAAAPLPLELGAVGVDGCGEPLDSLDALVVG